MKSSTPVYLLLLALAVLPMGCDKISFKTSGGGTPPPAAPPPQEVGVITLTAQNALLTTSLPGRVTPFRIAEVRPQANGIILKRMFEEGAEVKEGQQLYQIDPARYQVASDSTQATLAHAVAAEKSSRLLAERYKTLVKSRAVSQQEYDDAEAAHLKDEADVASAVAAVENSRINLVYTKVLSPISGRTGKSSVTEGALVTANQSEALVTVQQLDPIYVDITQPSVLLLKLQRQLAAGNLKSTGPGLAPVKLVLEDGTEYPHPGQLQFSEVTVDKGTGSVSMRAVFPNPEGMLLPGMFIHARLEEGIKEKAILVPQRAVTRNNRGQPTSLVVGPDGKVDLRILQTERAVGDKWLVTSGLGEGDKVIVEGLQKTGPGATVHTVEVQLDAQAKAPGH